jgi:hypothetical protein
MWSNPRKRPSSTAAFTRSFPRTAEVKRLSIRMTRLPLIAADMLLALLSVSVSHRWDHPSPPRQAHASMHTPITGVTPSGVVKRAPGKSHGCTHV